MRKYAVYVEELKEDKQNGSLFLTFGEDEVIELLGFCNTVLKAADHEVSVYIRRYDNA